MSEAFDGQPPGEVLRAMLSERGWTQADLAHVLGRPKAAVNEIVNGRRAITPETAVGLSKALGTEPAFWMDLEIKQKLEAALALPFEHVERRAHLRKRFPLTEMVKRSWLADTRDSSEMEERLREFLGVKSMDDDNMAVLAHAARKSGSYSEVTPAQMVWLARARKMAPGVHAERFTDTRFASALDELGACLAEPEELSRIPKILADGGVRFLVVQHLGGTKIDGACFWLNKYSPVVVLSLRYDRIDSFWHSFLHELGHVRERDGSIDADLRNTESNDGHTRPAQEDAADFFASSFAIPPDELDDFITRVGPLYHKAKIRGFARRIGVHPGIVVGQLQHRGEIRYEHNREMLVKVGDTLRRTALTDGWGFMPPV